MFLTEWYDQLLFVLHSSHSPEGTSPPPRWTCLLCAFGLFVYQSLDSIDGKQARRTNTSSPLGELFDHGCDSISTVFVALSACVSCQLGHYPNWLFFQVCANAAVILAFEFLFTTFNIIAVLLCDIAVLLCPLANLCVGHFKVWQNWRYRGSIHNHGHTRNLIHIWSRVLDDKGKTGFVHFHISFLLISFLIIV